MKNNNFSLNTLEKALRQAVPPLGRADAARVERACGRIAGIRKEPVSRSRHAVAKPLLRIAAGLVLLGSVITLLKNEAPAPLTDLPQLAAAPFLDALGTWEAIAGVTGSLADESANLVSDLATLTTVLNERSLAILF